MVNKFLALDAVVFAKFLITVMSLRNCCKLDADKHLKSFQSPLWLLLKLP